MPTSAAIGPAHRLREAVLAGEQQDSGGGQRNSGRAGQKGAARRDDQYGCSAEVPVFFGRDASAGYDPSLRPE
jgi:hypothetical protein